MVQPTRLLPLALLLAACGPARVGGLPSDRLPPDAGAPDAGPVDAGPADAGPVDAGPVDAGPVDAGSVDAGFDAGPPDAGPEDAGPEDAGPEDAGPEDAGPVDAGPADAGPEDAGPEDAGEPDAGPPDAGPPDAGPPDAGPVDAGPSSARQTAVPLGTNGAPNGYYEYLPPNYDDGLPRPLLVYWHGIGEDGNGTTELSKVLSNGPPKLIAADQWPNDRPYVVLSPQNPGTGCPYSGEISDFINWARANYRIDPQRTYLTGLSCGAIGSWQYLGDHATDGGIAAALLIAGDPGPVSASWSTWGKLGCDLGQVAIWSVHGDHDPTVNYGNDRDTMAQLLACPTPPRREAIYTEIDGGYHDTWSRTYDLSYGFQVYDFLDRNPLP